MEMKDEKHGAVTVVGLSGYIDATNAESLEKHLLALLEKGENRLLVAGEALEGVSSAGLRVFLAVAKRIHKSGGKMVLAGLSPAIHKVFEVTGLTKVFTILPTRDEGLLSFRLPISGTPS